MKKPTYVEVVVKVPKIKYEAIINHNTEWDEWTLETIRNGILLPKGHGDLIDADKMIKELNERIRIFDERRNEIYKQLGKTEENNQIPLWMWKGSCKTCGIIIKADKENEE